MANPRRPRPGMSRVELIDSVLDILQRPAPWHDVPDPVRDAFTVVCAPLELLQFFFPLRYFTSWCHLAILTYLSLCLTHTWCDPLVQGALWVLALYLPPSSLAMMALSRPLRRALTRSCGTPLCVAHQFATHVLPSLLVFLLTNVPRPPQPTGSASALFIAFLLYYNIALHVIWHASPLDNYYVHGTHERAAVAVVWFVTLAWACVFAEVLFAVVGRTDAGPRW